MIQRRTTRGKRPGGGAVEQRRSLGQAARHALDSADNHQADQRGITYLFIKSVRTCTVLIAVFQMHRVCWSPLDFPSPFCVFFKIHSVNIPVHNTTGIYKFQTAFSF